MIFYCKPLEKGQEKVVGLAVLIPEKKDTPIGQKYQKAVIGWIMQ
jgi:hypothetical protein